MIATQTTTSALLEVEAIKREWARGAEPDAVKVLARRPEWRADKSVVLDLAYEEYCRRYDAGERPDVEAFCERFPSHRLALQPLIQAHGILAENIDLLTAVAPRRWPRPGERLGDLTLLRELGRGAFARVYLAAEESTGGRPVAVKFSPEGADEARTMGRLVHPGVVPVLSARLEEGVGLTAVCMPFLGAATLTDLLDRAYPTPEARPPRSATVVGDAMRAASRPGDPAPLPHAADPPRDGPYCDAVARLGLEIAEALEFLHGEGVVHRDLKPSNVLLGPGGRALLLDFNLSADARAAGPRLGGTVPYSAPEQLRAWVNGGDARADGRTDLFALGVMLYLLLAGKNPFGAVPAGCPPRASAALLLERQARGASPLRELNPAVERRLARLIDDCLAFDPDRRPASAAVVAARLRDHLARPARLRRWAARHLWAMAAGLVLLGAGLAAAGLVMREAPPAAGGAPPPAAAQTGDRGPAEARAYQLGRDAYLSRDYSGALEAFSQAYQAAPSNERYLRARAEAELRLGEAGDQTALSAASVDLKALNDRRADGATMALLAYCFTRMRMHGNAIFWYDQAAGAGFDPPALYNDRGFSRLALGQVDEANADFTKAFDRDPNLKAALYNRGLAAISKRPPRNAPAIPDNVLLGMRTALEGAPPNRQAYLDAAQLFALAAADEQPPSEDKAGQAFRFLKSACELGADPERLAADPVFHSVLGNSPAFGSLKKGADQPCPSTVNLRLADPAPYLPG
jgi:tetratricopeptide (TPR) repeat protein